MPGTSLGQKYRIPRTASPQQTALYTYDMLLSLKRLAELNKQARLAALIGQAAEEAETVVGAKKTEEK